MAEWRGHVVAHHRLGANPYTLGGDSAPVCLIRTFCFHLASVQLEGGSYVLLVRAHA